MGEADFQSKRTVSISPGSSSQTSGALAESPGARLGPYTLVSLLGEGGFGVVWLAEQTEPLVRRVALKVIKPGMDSAAVVARFEQERQTLALMEHPNIARVIDAGATPSGRPYFVMEFVPGEPITDHCDKHNLSVRDRLALMAQVCDAVQHAHAKGVIHRDLKPSNVLVESVDGKPVPKIIDFGVAKAIQHAQAAAHRFTVEGSLIGTPEYMSPEQAAGSTDIDTRTDVYSLGVLLYELLTGSPPFESTALRVAGMAEIQRIIREVEPPRPSTRLSGADSARTAGHRGTGAGSLARQLRRELEWIPLKAMRKDRERRYSTAQEMATDIRRYLDGQALLAGPESRLYRARKFLSRHRVAAAAAACVLVAILAGAGVSIGYARAEHRARQIADLATRRAETERDTALSVRTYLVDDVLSSADPDEDGTGMLVETALDRAADALDARLGTRPEIEMRVAATLGRSLVKVGRPDRANEVLRRAKALAATTSADAPDREAVLSEIEEYLGEAMYRQAGANAAVPMLRERLGAMGPSGDPLRRADLLNQLGGALKWSTPADLPGSELAYREALQIREKMLGAKALDTLITRHNLQLIEARRAGAVPAEARPAAYRKVLGGTHALLEDTAAALGQDHPQTLAVRAEEAHQLHLAGDDQGAEAAYRGTLDSMRRVLTIRHWRTLETLGNYAVCLKALGRTDDEIAALEEAVGGYRFVRGETHADTQTCVEWLANALERSGCAECAGRTLERLYTDLARAGEPAARSRAVAERVAGVYERHGMMARAGAWRSKAAAP